VIYGVRQSFAKDIPRGGVVARDPESIQSEIEKTRDALADSLDALTDRANPKRFVDSGKAQAKQKLEDPKIKYALIAVGVILVAAFLKKLFS
jgi:hypothetical protein